MIRKERSLETCLEAQKKNLLNRSTLSGKNGTNPKHVFMNGTMNVITGFAFGTTLEFDSPGNNIFIN